jgi:pyridoxine kinase
VPTSPTSPTPDILSIQSAVAYGHVGNSAAVFPLQRLGFEVWPINTVQFSNHTGYGAWRGHVLGAEQVAEILEGVGERGALARCGAVLSGYLGDAALGAVVLDAVARVRAAAPGALYCCDPVMGDDGRGFFVRPGIPEFFRDRAVPRADIVTPNRFELEFLAGRPVATVEETLAAAEAVRKSGPSIVVVTSLRLPDLPADEIAMLADGPEGAWWVRHPLLPVNLSGTGDTFSALFLGHYLRERDLSSALARAAAATYAAVAATHAAGSREIRLVAAQDELVEPRQALEVTRAR